MEEILSTYNIITTILFLFWLLTYALRKELRQELLVVGIFSLFLVPFTIVIGADPQQLQETFAAFTVTDLLFAFSLTGIAATIFHIIFGKHYHVLPPADRKSKKEQRSKAQTWVLRLFILLVVFAWSAIILSLAFNLSTIQALLISAVILAVYIVSHRRDLLADAVWSSALTALIVYIVASITISFTGADIQSTAVVSDTFIGNVPLDLVLFAAALGMVTGPLYEYARRLEIT